MPSRWHFSRDPGHRRRDGPPGRRRRGPTRGAGASFWVPVLVCGGALLTLAVGLVAKAAGVDWGAPAQPLVVFLRPALSTWALPGGAVLAAALFARAAPPPRRVAVGPAPFAAAPSG